MDATSLPQITRSRTQTAPLFTRGSARESVVDPLGLEVAPGLGHVAVRREETRSGALKDGSDLAPQGSALIIAL